MYSTQLRTDDKTGEQLKMLAKMENRSINKELEYIIQNYIKQHKETV